MDTNKNILVATKQELKEQKHRCLAAIDNKQKYKLELKILRLMKRGI